MNTVLFMLNVFFIELITSFRYKYVPIVSELFDFRPNKNVKVIEPLVTIVLNALHLHLIKKSLLKVGIDFVIIEKLVFNIDYSL